MVWRKKRKYSRPNMTEQEKRLETLRKIKPYDKIIADARKAGKMSGGHYDSEKSIKANHHRWAMYYKEHPEVLAETRERRKRQDEYRRNKKLKQEQRQTESL